MLPSAEQPDKNPIHRKMIKIAAALTDDNLKKALIVNISSPPDFNFNGFIFPP
jgi:hypothetical protein